MGCQTCGYVLKREKKEREPPGVDTIDILAQRDEALLLLCQRRQRIVCAIRTGLQRQVSAMAVELPDETWIGRKGLWRGQLGSLVRPPKPSCASECWQARRSGQARTQQSENPRAASEILGERLKIRWRDGGVSCCGG